MEDKEQIVNECLTKLIAACALEKMKRVVAQNEDKWITIHPHGKDGGDGEGSDYRRLLIKDGETVEDAMHRQGYYNKRKAKDEKNKKDEVHSRSEKHPTAESKTNNNLIISKDIEQLIKVNLISKNDFALKAFKNAHIDNATYKILSNINKLGKIEIKKVGLDKGKYIPSILGEQATILANNEGTLYHEFAHSLDHRLGKELDKGNPKFDWLSNELTDINTEIINKLNFTLPKDLEQKFKEYTDKVNKELDKKINNVEIATKAVKDARTKYKDFDTFPVWLKENILRENINNEITKETKNIIKNMPDYIQWSTLSDMYSGLTMGRDSKDKYLGTHSQEYWLDQGSGLKSGKYTNINAEIFANYAEMRMGNYKEQLQYLKDNEPKLYNALDLLYNKVATEMEKL